MSYESTNSWHVADSTSKGRRRGLHSGQELQGVGALCALVSVGGPRIWTEQEKGHFWPRQASQNEENLVRNQ